MRWKALFDDLEAQVEAARRSDLDAEVRDRIRREGALLRLVDRLAAALDGTVELSLDAVGTVRGRLVATGPDWLLLHSGPEAGGQLLVPLPAVLSVAGLGPCARAPGSEGELARRLDLRHALRALVRDRALVQLHLRDGSLLSGTLDRVGSDYVEIAEHGLDEPRRARAVRGMRVVPLPALALVSSRRG